MLYTYTKAKPKQCAMHLEVINSKVYNKTTEVKTGSMTNILKNSRKIELSLF